MTNSQATISVRVYPGTATNEVVDFTDGILRIRVAAPPVKGKANKELVAFLSKVLGIGKSSLTIVKGHSSRNKVIAIDGLSQADVMEQLSLKLSSSGDAATGRG